MRADLNLIQKPSGTHCTCKDDAHQDWAAARKRTVLMTLWWNAEAWNDDVLHDLEPYVYDWVAEKRGSISAEHGLGQMKSHYIG